MRNHKLGSGPHALCTKTSWEKNRNVSFGKAPMEVVGFLKKWVAMGTDLFFGASRRTHMACLPSQDNMAGYFAGAALSSENNGTRRWIHLRLSISRGAFFLIFYEL